ncbi:NTPase, partial [Reticulomyxa filosa]
MLAVTEIFFFSYSKIQSLPTFYFCIIKVFSLLQITKCNKLCFSFFKKKLQNRVKKKLLQNQVKKKTSKSRYFPLAKMNKNCLFGKSTRKLKEYYSSQNKLAPLFDDVLQAIANCPVRLIRRTNNINNEEDEKCPNTMDYSLIYTEQKTTELEDIWKFGKKKEKNDEEDRWEDRDTEDEDEKERYFWIGIEEDGEKREKEEKIRHINIHGEAKTGKSILVQKISYLWAKKQLWNDRFQLLLQIPLRKIANIFGKRMDKNDDNIEDQWLKIMKELNIPQWNTDDTKSVINARDRLLLVLDGFDEIANELDTKPGLKQWLQHCIANSNYSILMTSRPNAICSYLNNKLRRFDIVGFQRRDIQNYVYGYFQSITDNDNNMQADALIKTLKNNPNLQLLSHTPLCLRLFCYLARQEMDERKEEQMKVFDELNNIPVSKLYEKLLECYMKWNWIKSNKTNKQNMFNTFKMEIDYLSQLAWEGLKCGQIDISCEIQERVLHSIQMKYPRKCTTNTSHWSQIYAFGFLQGQGSMNSSHPINSVYFPHLTFQEWLAAYYLVQCLYEPVESDNHKQVCSILINEQLNSKYSMMIPFMAGILYHNIENKKDTSGSGLLHFWKLLHSPSLCQLSPIHQMILSVCCLDACKADIDSSFLQSQIKNYHKTVINSFKSFLINWINFNKDKDNQLKLVENTLKEGKNSKLVTRLRYLNVSSQTSKMVIKYCQQGFQDKDNPIRKIYMNTFESIALKTQIDNIFKILLDGLHNKNKYIHTKCAKLIE